MDFASSREATRSSQTYHSNSQRLLPSGHRACWHPDAPGPARLSTSVKHPSISSEKLSATSSPPDLSGNRRHPPSQGQASEDRSSPPTPSASGSTFSTSSGRFES